MWRADGRYDAGALVLMTADEGDGGEEEESCCAMAGNDRWYICLAW